jgi:hypothetical protein
MRGFSLQVVADEPPLPADYRRRTVRDYRSGTFAKCYRRDGVRGDDNRVLGNLGSASRHRHTKKNVFLCCVPVLFSL